MATRPPDPRFAKQPLPENGRRPSDHISHLISSEFAREPGTAGEARSELRKVQSLLADLHFELDIAARQGLFSAYQQRRLSTSRQDAVLNELSELVEAASVETWSDAGIDSGDEQWLDSSTDVALAELQAHLDTLRSEASLAFARHMGAQGTWLDSSSLDVALADLRTQLDVLCEARSAVVDPLVDDWAVMVQDEWAAMAHTVLGTANYLKLSYLIHRELLSFQTEDNLKRYRRLRERLEDALKSARRSSCLSGATSTVLAQSSHRDWLARACRVKRPESEDDSFLYHDQRNLLLTNWSWIQEKWHINQSDLHCASL